MNNNQDEYKAFENHMENIIRRKTILTDYINLPRTNAEFDAFCERMSRIAHESSVLCS